MTILRTLNLRMFGRILVISACFSCVIPRLALAGDPPTGPAATSPATVPVANSPAANTSGANVPAGKASQPPAVTIGKSLVKKPAITPEQKRRVIVLTTFFAAGIVTILFLLLGWIFWFSRRTHRLLREPLPAAKPGDELWYLKAKHPPAQPSDPPSPESPTSPPPS